MDPYLYKPRFEKQTKDMIYVFVSKAEAEVRVAQGEFDRQVEATRLLLEGISSTHVCIQQD
jgi:hypothetical protein